MIPSPLCYWTANRGLCIELSSVGSGVQGFKVDPTLYAFITRYGAR